MKRNALNWRKVMNGERADETYEMKANGESAMGTRASQMVNLENPNVMYSNSCASLGNVSGSVNE